MMSRICFKIIWEGEVSEGTSETQLAGVGKSGSWVMVIIFYLFCVGHSPIKKKTGLKNIM